MLQHLLLLQRTVSLPHASGGELAIDELIQWVIKCEYARIDESALSAEYGVNMQTTDNPQSVAEAVFSDGVSRLMRSGSIGVRRWILHHAVEVSALSLRTCELRLIDFSEALAFCDRGCGDVGFTPEDLSKTAQNIC